MAVDSKAKGSRTEMLVRDTLRKYTGLNWERTPLSGALNAVHGLKADIYVPNEKNLFSVEIKGYADDHVTSKILTDKNPQILEWWKQCIRQAKETDKVPLLIFKFDRSKLFVAFTDIPTSSYRTMFIDIDGHSFFVAKLEDWLECERPKFIK